MQPPGRRGDPARIRRAQADGPAAEVALVPARRTKVTTPGRQGGSMRIQRVQVDGLDAAVMWC